MAKHNLPWSVWPPVSVIDKHALDIPETRPTMPALSVPSLDQSLFYRNTLREFNRGPHDPVSVHI